MLEYIIYKLIRDDGKLYIGTTDTKNFKNRMSQHKSARRFCGHTFDVVVLKQSSNSSILDEEGFYIESHDSLAPSGLNLTRSGKGYGHASVKFTTRGYQYSDASRAKMSASAKKRCAMHPRTGWAHSEETKRQWSIKRKGIDARKTMGKTLQDVRSE